MKYHNYVRNDDFNILTAKRVKGHLIFTGETKNPIEVGDVINYGFGGFNEISVVDKVIERRDSKSFPKGNGLFYSVECSGKVLTEAEQIECGLIVPTQPV